MFQHLPALALAQVGATLDPGVEPFAAVAPRHPPPHTRHHPAEGVDRPPGEAEHEVAAGQPEAVYARQGLAVPVEQVGEDAFTERDPGVDAGPAALPGADPQHVA